MVRASCILQLALGNIGKSGGGANIFRGHDNVQGATDVGPNPDSLPGYYGLATGSWKHWANVGAWTTSGQGSKRLAGAMMEKSGITVSRWIDGVLENKDHRPARRQPARGGHYWGHAPNSQTRGAEMVEAMKKLDTLVVIDPYPSATAAMRRWCEGRRLPAAGLHPVRDPRLGDRVEPFDPVAREGHRALFESKPDHTIMYAFAKKFGLGRAVREEHQAREGCPAGWDEPSIEDTLREINRGTWTIGYTGQSPERLKLHMKNMHTFDVKTLKAVGGPATASIRSAVAVLRHARR